jgi:hypothetical protein
MVYNAPASQNRSVMPTLSVPRITVDGELKIPVPVDQVSNLLGFLE